MAKKQKQLDMRAIQQLQRINKQTLQKAKFHGERNQYMTNILNKQKQVTYESEYDRLEAQRVKSGRLGAEAHNRLQLLKALINK